MMKEKGKENLAKSSKILYNNSKNKFFDTFNSKEVEVFERKTHSKLSDDKEVSIGLRLLAKTSMIVFFAVAMSKVLGYVYRIIVARYFGAEVYGLFSLALMVSGWIIAIAGLGLVEGLVRFVPLYRGKKDDKKIRYVFNLSLIISLVSSVVSGIALFVLASFISEQIFHNSGLIIYLQIFSLLIPITIFAHLYTIMLRAYEKINLYSFVFNVVQNVVKVLALVVFIVLGWKSTGIAWSYLLGLFSMFIVSYLICKRIIPKMFGKSGISKQNKTIVSREFLNYSWPLLFFGIISVIMGWVDSFFIGYFKGAIEVGFYNAALPIAALLGVVPELFMQLFFPMINREYAQKKIHVIRELSKQVAKWILIVNLPGFILIILFPGAALNILFGAEYLVAESALRILAIGALISSVFMVSHQLISMTGRSKLVLTNIIIATVINTILNFILVPMEKIGFIENSTGINGAALATAISIIIFSSLFFIQANYYLAIASLRRKMIRVILVAIIPTIVLLYFKSFIVINMLSIILLAGLFFVLYFALMIVTGSFDRNDLMILRTVWKKVRG